MMMHKWRSRQGALLMGLGVLAIVLLVTIPLVLEPNGAFGGSDNAGTAAIRQLAPQYDPTWTSNWWRPPGTETESMLFALQAAAGALLIGYAFGYLQRAQGSLVRGR